MWMYAIVVFKIKIELSQAKFRIDRVIRYSNGIIMSPRTIKTCWASHYKKRNDVRMLDVAMMCARNSYPNMIKIGIIEYWFRLIWHILLNWESSFSQSSLRRLLRWCQLYYPMWTFFRKYDLMLNVSNIDIVHEINNCSRKLTGTRL